MSPQMTPYYVSSSEATAIFPGDVVMFTSLITVKRVPTSSTGTILGVAANFVDANGGSTGANYGDLTKMVLVYDNPNQLFVACVSSSYILGSTDINKRCTALTSAGSTTLKRSAAVLSGETASSAGGAFTLVGLHPVEGNNYSTAAGAAAGAGTDVRKWVVKPVSHYYGPAQGAIVTST